MIELFLKADSEQALIDALSQFRAIDDNGVERWLESGSGWALTLPFRKVFDTGTTQRVVVDADGNEADVPVTEISNYLLMNMRANEIVAAIIEASGMTIKIPEKPACAFI